MKISVKETVYGALLKSPRRGKDGKFEQSKEQKVVFNTVNDTMTKLKIQLGIHDA